MHTYICMRAYVYPYTTHPYITHLYMYNAHTVSRRLHEINLKVVIMVLNDLYIHIYIQMYACTCICIDMHPYSLTHTCICIDMHPYSLSHTHTHTQHGRCGVPQRLHTHSQSHLGWHFRKLKAQSSNVSFATFQWKETFELWALSFWNSIRKCHPKRDRLYMTHLMHIQNIYRSTCITRIHI